MMIEFQWLVDEDVLDDCIMMLLMGPVQKLNEMWPSNCGVVFQEYPV